MIGLLPQYQALVSALDVLLAVEVDRIDVEGRELVDIAHSVGHGSQRDVDWRAVERRAIAWLGRRPHPALDGGWSGAVQADPRTRRYAALRRLQALCSRVRQADTQVGGPEIHTLLGRAAAAIPELVSHLDGWPARTAGQPSMRDPGAGTGHREW